MTNRKITALEVIAAIHCSNDIDEMADELEVSAEEFRQICDGFKIDITAFNSPKMFYFTFGQDHVTKDGFNMSGSWVNVIADDSSIARKLFVEQFTSIYMQAPNKFAFQYEQKDIDFTKWAYYYPNGQYFLITQ